MPQIIFAGQIKREVTPPAPVPTLRLSAQPDLRGIPQQAPPYAVVHRSAMLTVGGVDLPNIRWENQPYIGQQFSNETGITLTLAVDLHRYLVEAIESKRVDDVACTLRIDLVFSKQGSPIESNSGTAEFTLSEKEWTTLLERAGYRAGWTAYIERGKTEGWSEVAKHISGAHDRLLAHDPTGVLVACRAAFRSADKIVSGDWLDIAVQIDRGSTSEPGYDPK